MHEQKVKTLHLYATISCSLVSFLKLPSPILSSKRNCERKKGEKQLLPCKIIVSFGV